MIERTFNERYRLDGKLGEGGMATVFCGTDTVLRRRVAIKVLRPQFAADADFVRRFYHEAESAARLTYPNIVSIYDVGREADTYFIVMELVDGSTLGDLIEADPRLPEAVAIDYAEQVCRGLAYAHRQGILHRDIKPANILITKDDVVKLSDFGIARAVTTQTMTMTAPGLVMGSVFYLSPEQAQGHELHETSDLYSFGVVLYQMLTGRLPYTGESPITVALKHVSSPLPEIGPSDGVSPALAAVVEKLLQKRPEDRYQSATEVASALRAARDQSLAMTVAGRSVAPRPARIPNPPPRPAASPLPAGTAAYADGRVARRRAPVPLLTALGVLLLVAAALGYYLAGRPGGLLGTATVSVPGVLGRPVTEAQQRLQALGLRVAVTQSTSETVERGRVIAQEPTAGTRARTAGVVRLVVSAGLPKVNVVDLRSYSVDDALRYLHNAKVASRVIEKYDVHAAGTVLAQSPGAGGVPMRSLVTLTVSKGLPPVAVPSVVTLSLDAATAALRRAGLRLQIGERVASDNIPTNVVASQDPEAGRQVDSGSAVTVAVSSGPAGVQVPDVGGRSVGDATAAIANAGLIARLRYAFEPGAPLGNVIDVSPPAGSSVKHGAAVTLTVVVSGIVPNVTGMTLDDAKEALRNAGYRVGNVAYTQTGPDGRVAYTEPRAGTTLDPGETVSIYYNDGSGGGAAPVPSATASVAPTPAPSPT